MDEDNQRLPLCIAVHLSLVTTLSQNNNKNMHAVVDPQFAEFSDFCNTYHRPEVLLWFTGCLTYAYASFIVVI